MTFHDFCRSLDGKYVKVWTANTTPADDGTPICYCGRLTAHEDFLEVLDDAYFDHFGIPIAAVTAICERSDSPKKVAEEQQFDRMLQPPSGRSEERPDPHG
jgi:hypothetical protein